MAEKTGVEALLDAWRKQTEEGAQAWLRQVAQPSMSAKEADLSQFWRPAIEQWMAASSGLLAQAPTTPELAEQWKRSLDQWIAAWSRALEQAMGTEAFAQALGRYLDQWLSQQGPAKTLIEQATDTSLAALGLPSRSQVTAIARQQADLEDRLEGLEDRLDTLLTRMDGLVRLVEAGDRPARRRTPSKEVS